MPQDEFKKLRGLVKDIKGSHFKLGDGMNDYKTTTGQTYNFDANKALGAKGKLRDELISDLRSTHYKLGYDPSTVKTTTHQSTYTPLHYQEGSGNKNVSEDLRKSHFNLNNSNLGNIGKTIYMTDFTKKEVPNDCY